MKLRKFINILLFVLLISGVTCGCKQKKKPSAASASVKKKIITQPEGATVFYNGRELGKTPHILTARPGAYTIKLVKKGYKTRFARFSVKKTGNVPDTFKLEPASSSIMISSNPAQASVIRDNKRIGETPMVISDLAFGKYSIRLEKSGYASKDLSFNIDSERPKKISTDLDSNIGSISITTNPKGARIYMNGKNIGITPFNGEFADGTHTFTLRYNNYADITAAVTIQKGKKISIHRNLNLLPGSFNITSEPSKAQVYVNNKYMGTTPLVLKDIPSNVNHKITVRRKGFASQTANHRTSPGKQEPINFNLKRSLGDLELVINPPGVTVYIDNIKYGVTKKSDTSKTSQVMLIKNLSPGEHTIRYTHRRAKPSSKSRKVKIVAGEVTRPAPMSLWIPNAEIIYNDDSTEDVIILSQNADGIFVEPNNNIRYTILRSNIKKINYLKDDQ